MKLTESVARITPQMVCNHIWSLKCFTKIMLNYPGLQLVFQQFVDGQYCNITIKMICYCYYNVYWDQRIIIDSKYQKMSKNIENKSKYNNTAKVDFLTLFIFIFETELHIELIKLNQKYSVSGLITQIVAINNKKYRK